MQIERIVVGVDGSDNGRLAATWAAGLAAATGAEVVAVHALGLLTRATDDEPVPAHPHRDEVRATFEADWCAPLDDTRCRRLLRDGNPVQVVLAVADEVAADLVVLGSRGVGGFPEQLLGSTSTQVAQGSTRPVVIVPTAWDRHGRGGPGSP